MLSAQSLRLMAEPSQRDMQRRNNRQKLQEFRHWRRQGYTATQARHIVGL